MFAGTREIGPKSFQMSIGNIIDNLSWGNRWIRMHRTCQKRFEDLTNPLLPL